MKGLFGILIIVAAVIPGINDIATINKLKREAREAFLAGNYAKAAEAYTILSDSMGVTEDKVLLNLGHALFQNGDSLQAFSQYQRLINSTDQKLRSTALNQMGILTNNPQERSTALNYFKEAMKADPSNAEARYNYQVLKKKVDEEKEQNKDQQQDQENQEKNENEQKDQQNQQDQNQQDQNQQNKEQQEQQNKDQQNQEQQNQDQQNQQQQDQKSEEQKEQEQQNQQQEDQQRESEEQQPQQINPDKLKEMNISEEKARMILEAMRNSEIQYIQQNKRKGTKRPESGKPDW